MKQLLVITLFISLQAQFFAQTPSPEWGEMAICAGFYKRIDKLVLNSNGGVYAAGSFESENLEFDGVTYTNFSKDTVSSYISKVDENGNVEWVRLIGGKRNDFIQQIVTDASDNLYVYGYTNSDDLQLGDLKLTGLSPYKFNRGFLAKFDANGNLLWHKILGNVFDFYASSMVMDQQGNVVVTGDYNDETIKIDQFSLVNKGGTRNTKDVVLVKYDPNGNTLFAVGLGGFFDETAFLAKDNNDNFILLMNSVDYNSVIISSGTVTLTGAMKNNYQFLVFNKDGVPLWSKYAGNSFNVSEMKVDSDNSLYVIGSALSLRSTINIQKFSASLEKVREKNFGGTSDEKGWSMVFDGKGNVLITGKFKDTSLGLTSTMNIKNIEYGLSDYPSSDSYIIRLDTNFTVNYGYRIASYSHDEAFALVLDSEKEKLYLGGSTYSNKIYFGKDTIPYMLNNDNYSAGAFLFKLNLSASTATFGELTNESNIYPNPTQGSFSINSSITVVKSIQVFNTLGQLVFTDTLQNGSLNVETNNWNKGVYIVQLADESGKTLQVERLIVQ